MPESTNAEIGSTDINQEVVQKKEGVIFSPLRFYQECIRNKAIKFSDDSDDSDGVVIDYPLVDEIANKEAGINNSHRRVVPEFVVPVDFDWQKEVKEAMKHVQRVISKSGLLTLDEFGAVASLISPKNTNAQV